MGLTLSVSDIVQVNVNAAAPPQASKPFNQGLIIGPSTHIPSLGANSRLRQYASLTAISADGFLITDPEYISAQLYFSQNPTPTFVWIGRQDLTAIETAIPHSGNAGTGYVVGDTVTVVQGGGSGGKLTVLTVGGGGAVTSLGTTIGNQGTGYAVATTLTTTGGTGTGLEVDITAVGETYAQAVQACALVNQSWYPFMCCNATDSDHTALAALSTANWQTYLYIGSSPDTTIPAGTAGNIALTLQATKGRYYLDFHTTQGGTFPNNVFAAAAIMGVACGLSTGLAGSAFTLNLKTLVGIAPEPLTQTQYNAIAAANCNTSTSFGPYTGVIVSGVLGSGEWYDQILFRAMYVNMIQTNIMNLLTSVPKIPQTDAGEHQLIAQVDAAASTMASIGYIGSGTWTGAPIVFSNGQVALTTGQSLPQGFLDVAPSFSTQSSAAQALRQAMPIYSAIIEAGAVHSVVIQVNTQL